MTQRTLPIRLTTLAAAAAALVIGLLSSGPATAIVPPKDCHIIKVNGHRYNVKADQVSCKFARRAASRYLGHGIKPRGYTCRKYKKSETSLAFRCENRHTNPVRTVFAIRR